MIIQFCGLSGSGKTTLANHVNILLDKHGIKAEIIDGDVYRKTLCGDLGFSKADRHENIRRLAALANERLSDNTIPIISAINPYDDIRREIASRYKDVKTVYIDCSMEVLIARDTKQLYRKAMLPEGHPEKISNLSGINDPFDIPAHPDLTLKTDEEPVEISSEKLLQFILSTLP